MIISAAPYMQTLESKLMTTYQLVSLT